MKTEKMRKVILVTVFLTLAPTVFAESLYKAIKICEAGGWDGKNLTINETGQVAGTGGYAGAFFWDKGELVTIANGYNDRAYGMNNLGQVVGVTNYNVFFWDNGEYLNLGKFGGSNAQGRAINDSGQIVGYWDAYAVFFKDGDVNEIVPGVAIGINNSGEVVGSHSVNGKLSNERAFLYSNEVITNFELGGGISRAYGINESGQVVGCARSTDGKYHAFFWDNNVLTDLGISGTESRAWGINDLGQIVGLAGGEAVIWNNGVMTNLKERLLEGSEWEMLECAFEINNSGQIVGRGRLISGEDYIFLLIPAYHHVDGATGNNGNYGQTRETAFETIQFAIDTAEDDDTILVWPGTYTEALDFKGKAITLQNADEPPVLQAPGDYGVSFFTAEEPNSVLKNFIITGSDLGVFINSASPTISNVTIAGNGAGIEAWNGANPNIANSIFWNNPGGNLFQCEATYSYLLGVDPFFVDSNNGDYRLKSEGWRYSSGSGQWTWDDVTSPCIDAGNPGTPLGDELMTVARDPDNLYGINLRVNMGAYGGTAQASMAPHGWALLGDLNNDGCVDGEDLAGQVEDWLMSDNQQPGDLNRDGVINMIDFAKLAQEWLDVVP